jgi:multiple sugar transport system substrate-binding protein
MTVELRGLTWDHPRGYLALDALTAIPHPSGSVRWQRQSLEDFESRPLRTLADDFDLLVMDHPGLGEAVRDGSLRPLDALFSAGELAAWRDLTIGASFDSYLFGGHQWALPLDAATQVAVGRPELVAERAASWEEARRLARAHRTTLCLGGPHALLMFAAICVALGSAPATDPGVFVPGAIGGAALDIMADLLAHADPELSLANPIGVLEAMTADDGPSYCPLVYGYVTYQRPGRRPHRLSAFDAPAGVGGIGSVLGGTGVAISRSCSQPAAAADQLRRLLSEPVQLGLFSRLGGQSSYRAAWADADADRCGGGFYSATRHSMERAWVRPRFAGYVAFQAAASAVLRGGLRSGEPADMTLGRVDELYLSAQQGNATSDG